MFQTQTVKHIAPRTDHAQSRKFLAENLLFGPHPSAQARLDTVDRGST